MPRIRTIKPEFWTSPQVVHVPVPARLLFIGTWNFADDNGNLQHDAEKLKLQVFPADEIDVAPLLDSLIAHGLLTEYSVSGRRYLHIPGFRDHQVINRPSRGAYPLPPDGDVPPAKAIDGAASGDAHGALTEHSRTERKGKGKELTPLKPKPKSANPRAREPRATRPNRGEGFDVRAYLFARGIDAGLATDWLTLRKAKDAPPTRTALDGIEREATKAGLTLADALRVCCERGWRGFKAEWLEHERHAGHGPPRGNGSRESVPLTGLDAGALDAMARELGIAAARPGESLTAFVARIEAARDSRGLH
jgi:hypothetical protein